MSFDFAFAFFLSNQNRFANIQNGLRGQCFLNYTLSKHENEVLGSVGFLKDPKSALYKEMGLTVLK